MPIITTKLPVKSNIKGDPELMSDFVCCDCGPVPTNWLIFVVNDHNHLQCNNCGTSYCNGRCEEQ